MCVGAPRHTEKPMTAQRPRRQLPARAQRPDHEGSSPPRRRGRIPAGLPNPIRDEYDPTIRAYQRTRAFVMDRDLVPVFTAASQPSMRSERSCRRTASPGLANTGEDMPLVFRTYVAAAAQARE
jgi:hypothetical protein